MFKKLLSTAALTVMTVFAAANAQALYQEIKPNVDPIYDPNKIEVVEIFSYACPACNTFEPYFAAWKESQKDVADVEVISLAAPGQAIWSLYAKAFYTLEAMNALGAGHQAFFDAIHKDRQRFINKDQIADFMAKQGIDRDKFLKAWDGFAATSAYNRAENLIANQYRVPFTPAIVVDGRYLLSADSASKLPGPGNPYEKLIKNIDDVIVLIREERAQQSGGQTAQEQ